jgi:CheY-like chemotaxis protein
MPLTARVSLMIVEDDPNIRFLLDAAARRTELFEPIIVEPDGLAAWEALHTFEPATLPAIIVTDLSMPRMNGCELLLLLKSDNRLKHIPVAVITSSNLPHDRERTLNAGACAFVEKLYGVDALSRALVGIREVCESALVAAGSR